MTIGIYQIINKNNGKSYIGQSVNLENRRRNHFYLLRNNKSHNARLQNSFNKYGLFSFEFKLLIVCEKEYLTFFEQFFVDTLKPEFNFERECVDSTKGRKITEEHRLKLILSHKGQIPWNKGLKGFGLGRIVPQKTKKKMAMSAINYYNNMSEEDMNKYKKKCKAVWRERYKSGNINSGKRSQETIEKIRNSNKTRFNNMSIEEKVAYSEKCKKVWEKRKATENI